MYKFSRIFLLTGLIFSFTPLIAQKVKYKDLFPLLDSKRYEEAEPFLKTYLTQDPEHANANLQMGLLLDSKTRKSDIFKDKDGIQQYADSAIIFYNKFGTLLNEKEIKKRDEYYQDYNRRDLRTGKFEIKEQDIRFDMDKRIKELNEYKDRVASINKYMSDAIRQYHTAKSSFIYLSRTEPSLNDFFLASSLVTEESLDYMSKSYDSALVSLNEIKELLEEIENETYLQGIQYETIEDYKQDGYADADFYSEEFKLWDYKTWANSINSVINGEIKPMRENLLEYSKQLNNLYINPEPELLMLNNVGNFDQMDVIRKFDPNPFPEQIFDYKKMEILYRIESNDKSNPLLADSVNVDNLIQAESNYLTILGKADSLINNFGNSDELKHETRKHTDFVNQEFTNLESLENFISFKRDWVKQMLESHNNAYDSLVEFSKYAYLEQDTLLMAVPEDSSVSVSTEAIENGGPVTLSSIQTDSLDYYLSGVKLAGDSSSFFMTKVLPSRRAQWVMTEPLDSFLNGELGATAKLSLENKTAQNYDCWVFMRVEGEAKEQGVLFRFSKDGEKLWSKPLELSSSPTDFKVDGLSMESTITLSDGTTMVINAAGEAK